MSIPRANTDPIIGPTDALALLATAVERPLQPHTIVLPLDRRRCAHTIVTVTGTADPDAVLGVVEILSAASDQPFALAVASVRPHDGLLPDDADRWFEMSHIISAAGGELLEWWVISDRIECPRDQLGEAPRW